MKKNGLRYNSIIEILFPVRYEIIFDEKNILKFCSYNKHSNDGKIILQYCSNLSYIMRELMKTKLWGSYDIGYSGLSQPLNL